MAIGAGLAFIPGASLFTRKAEGYSQFTPHDPYYGSQWGLHRIGMPAAWNYSPINNIPNIGSSNVIVCTIDSGADYNHDDLGVSPNPCLISGGGQDRDGHGTQVTGIIAAYSSGNWNALEGIAGMAPASKILPYRVYDYYCYPISNSTIENNIVNAINDVAARAASNSHNRYIINMSWQLSRDVISISNAIASAVSHRNCLAVCGAGDSGCYIGSVYPACYSKSISNLIPVAATDPNDMLIKQSCYGSNVVCAPGTGIVTDNAGNSYVRTAQGTGMAAAFVSGLAAVLWARDLEKYGGRYSNSDIRSIIQGQCVHTGNGYGRIQADSSMTNI